MAKRIYHDGFPYKTKYPAEEYKGKHYFPVFDEDGRFLYWVRGDLVNVPWFFFKTPEYDEDDLILDYDDFVEQPGYRTDSYEEVLDNGDAIRQARHDAYVERMRAARQTIDSLAEMGIDLVPQPEAPKGGGCLLTIAAILIVVILGTYGLATQYTFPKIFVRGVTQNWNIPMSVGNVCRSNPGDDREAIETSASNLFGTNVDYESLGAIEKVMSGRCFDGIRFTGGKNVKVQGGAGLLISATSKEELPPSLPNKESGCILNLKDHPGKALCQNVGPFNGDGELISDVAYWMAAYEPDMVPSSSQAP